MGRKIKIDLSVSGINKLIQEIEDYKNGLPRKCELFCRELADEGIYIARTVVNDVPNLGNVSNMIYFGKELTPSTDGCSAILYGEDIDKIVSKWILSDGSEKTAIVSPILMAEVGSGKYASNPLLIPNAGRGTFPDQKHAFDTKGWFWKEYEGDEWHHSYGIQPTMPMYNAWLRMYGQVTNVARKVFQV